MSHPCRVVPTVARERMEESSPSLMFACSSTAFNTRVARAGVIEMFDDVSREIVVCDHASKMISINLKLKDLEGIHRIPL